MTSVTHRDRTLCSSFAGCGCRLSRDTPIHMATCVSPLCYRATPGRDTEALPSRHGGGVPLSVISRSRSAFCSFVCWRACVQDRAHPYRKAIGASGCEHAGAWGCGDGPTFEQVYDRSESPSFLFCLFVEPTLQYTAEYIPCMVLLLLAAAAPAAWRLPEAARGALGAFVSCTYVRIYTTVRTGIKSSSRNWQDGQA